MGDFERVRGSSKAFLLLSLLLFLFYKFIVVLRMVKTNCDQEVTFISYC